MRQRKGALAMSLIEPTTETDREDCTRVLATERLVLRAPRREDVKAVAALAGDRRVAENTLQIPHPYGVGDAAQWIAAANTRPGETTFVIEHDGETIGACGFDIRNGAEPEIGYWLGVPFWGQGFATEAVRALIDHAFESYELPALQAGARVSNSASRRVLEKCGFQWTGVALYRMRAIASSAPCDRFRLERRIWASLKSWGANTRRDKPARDGDGARTVAI
jgi:RimJ/RimL family protein N-acetyltransferase